MPLHSSTKAKMQQKCTFTVGPQPYKFDRQRVTSLHSDLFCIGNMEEASQLGACTLNDCLNQAQRLKWSSGRMDLMRNVILRKFSLQKVFKWAQGKQLIFACMGFDDLSQHVFTSFPELTKHVFFTEKKFSWHGSTIALFPGLTPNTNPPWSQAWKRP